jgi:hypothetical protein
MHEMRKALVAIAKGTDLIPTTIYYAFKQSEMAADGVTSAGWATFLQAVVESGLAVDATWPVRTEATNALKKDVNALASSIVLVCRRRDAAASSITRADFLRALRRAAGKIMGTPSGDEHGARLCRDQGRRQEARNLLAPVHGWFTQGFDTLDLKQSKRLLDELAP